MASRIAIGSLRAAVRPRAFAALPQSFHARSMATTPTPPSERASEIIEKLPSSPSLITKTGTALLGVGAAAAAISQELYVVNEETIVLVASIIVFTYIGKVIREPYSQWAEGHIQRIKKILNDARAEHTGAVQERIDSVAQMKDVVSITKGLFALSKETAVIENSNFVQLQKIQLAAELKSVLDSWVRYEQQVKDAEQADLTKTVIEKVVASLKDEKTQKDILASAIVEIEELVKSKAI
ncbi:ATP synthase [Pholiota conissans]|uniref:ATP synthase subunit 4 n=1 Tax=Pholiota conissans TaxID=109636 RepID=A0A9P5Z1A8_9AGAR|nr:ATP synthase [Pholiota conissans]